LSTELVLENDLMITTDTFAKSLLADQGQQVGAYDSRFLLPSAASATIAWTA